MNRGYNIGCRLIEDYLARTYSPQSPSATTCKDFKETAETISKVGFKMFLNVCPVVSGWSSDGLSFSLILSSDSNSSGSSGANPFAEFVELPTASLQHNQDNNDNEQNEKLWYSNVLCGVIRGALEMVQMQVRCEFVSDQLHGDDETVIRVTLDKYLDERVPVDDD